MTEQKTESKNNEEQIKNKTDFYSDLKLFVEKDEFGLFKTKEIKKIEREVIKSQKEIQSLLDMKVKATELLLNLSNQKKTYQQQVLITKTEIVKGLK